MLTGKYRAGKASIPAGYRASLLRAKFDPTDEAGGSVLRRLFTPTRSWEREKLEPLFVVMEAYIDVGLLFGTYFLDVPFF